MRSPLIRRPRKNESNDANSKQRGVTLALVAVSLVAMIAMAALSIDVGTLYQAKAEAQRAADAAALTAARLISISGVTGDPTNASGSWQTICGNAGTATLAAKAVAQSQSNFVGGFAPTPKVTYGTGAGSDDCSTLAGPGSSFSVNPTVTVYVQQAKLPTFFARVFSLITNGTSSNSGVSATATAEVYNPSGSGSLASGMVPVQPRCVKPLIIPNIDPANAPNGFVKPDGTIFRTGISPAGEIGETFNMNADCVPGAGNCQAGNMEDNPPTWNGKLPQELEYVPALGTVVQGTSGAVPSCTAEGNWTASNFQQAIAGCDQTTVYACGTPNGGQVDLTENPVSPSAATGDTATGVACLTNSSAGADTLAPATYPFQITMGGGNPLSKQGVAGLITTSNSIVTVPIYDGKPLVGSPAPVTIVGFLQVFVNQVNADGSLNVTVMNVAGCSNDATNPPVGGTSPVPVRLITPP
jgi:Flp pilus assembly protein TadG